MVTIFCDVEKNFLEECLVNMELITRILHNITGGKTTVQVNLVVKQQGLEKEDP